MGTEEPAALASPGIRLRRGGSAKQTVLAACRHVATGHEWVCDIDLDAFFNRVQHGALMAMVATRVHDKQVLALIRRYPEAGVMSHGRRARACERGGSPAGVAALAAGEQCHARSPRLRARAPRPPFRALRPRRRRMAAQAFAAGALEGVEAPPHAAALPARAL